LLLLELGQDVRYNLVCSPRCGRFARKKHENGAARSRGLRSGRRGFRWRGFSGAVSACRERLRGAKREDDGG
jgi:hypothetical protein